MQKIHYNFSNESVIVIDALIDLVGRSVWKMSIMSQMKCEITFLTKITRCWLIFLRPSLLALNPPLCIVFCIQLDS
jgi:hypothetical protein